MCGLFGMTQPNLERARIALDTLTHRGPDQSGEWFDPNLYVGHRRLSILDLSENGRQPMVDKKTGVVIAVNGEIYNFQELRKQLRNQYPFKSQSDSEVILHGYQAWGIDGLLARIDGMYAISIFDPRSNQIYLARDIAGIKPLYYYLADGQFGWASELKALRKYIGSDQLQYDYTALYDFLTYLYIPPPKSLYRDIYKLEAAHYACFDLTTRQFTKKRFWSLPTATQRINLAEAREQLKALVVNSIDAHMVSDVPVGFFLSGGIDSSVVVGAASQVSNKINSYTIGFDVAGYDESGFAESVARMHRTQHRCEIMQREQSINLYAKLKDWFDEPHADTSALPTYMVSKLAKQQVSVVLTGDGGDEIFGGYVHYFKFAKMNRGAISKLHSLKTANAWAKQHFHGKEIAKAFSNLERRFFLNDLELHTRLLGGMLKDEKHRYRNQFNIPGDYDDYWFFRQYYRPELPTFSRLQHLDFHSYLPEDILTKVDRTSMAVSLEARVPFICKQIIEFSFSLPDDIRLPGSVPKGLLKQTFSDLLPEGIVDRKKKGFTIPMKSWRDDFFGDHVFPQEQILKNFYL